MKKLVIKAATGSMTQFRSELENKIAEIQHSDVQNSQIISTSELALDNKSKGRILNMLEGHNQKVLRSYDEGDRFVVACQGTGAKDTSELWEDIQDLEFAGIACKMDPVQGRGFYDVKYTFYRKSEEDVQSCDRVVAQTIPEDDPARIRYLHDLVGWVQYQMEREDLPANQTTFDTTDDALIIIVDGDNLMQYEVPFEDLKFDFDRIWEDVDYIIGAMI